MSAYPRRSALLAAGLLVTLGAGLGAAAGLAAPTTGASTPLPGRLAYFSDSNDYRTPSTEVLATSRPDGSDRQVLFTNATDSFGFPAYSPNGQELAYFQADGSKKAGIEVLDVGSKATTTVFTLTAKGSDVGGIAWTPDGQDLVFGSNQTTTGTVKKNGIWEVPATGGTPTSLTPQNGAVAPAIAPDGNIYYVVPSSSGTGPSALWEMDADGSGAHLVYRSSRTIDLPAVAPDGRTVAFSVSTNATTSHIVAIPSQGGKSKSLTPLVKGRDDTDPAWSPDGSHLAFLSSRAGRHEGKRSNQLLDGYVMAANGSGVTRVVGLKGNKAGVDWITWGPGGS